MKSTFNFFGIVALVIGFSMTSCHNGTNGTTNSISTYTVIEFGLNNANYTSTFGGQEPTYNELQILNGAKTQLRTKIDNEAIPMVLAAGTNLVYNNNILFSDIESQVQDFLDNGFIPTEAQKNRILTPLRTKGYVVAAIYTNGTSIYIFAVFKE